MVARPSHGPESRSTHRLGRFCAAWFRTWQRLLGRAGHTRHSAHTEPIAADSPRLPDVPGILCLQQLLTRSRAHLRDLGRFVRDPSLFGALDPASADSLAASGVRLFILGVGGSLAVGMWRTGTLRPAIAAAITTTAWALARLAVMVFLAPRGRHTRAVVAAVWAASLAPFVAGVTPGLRALALLGSALLAHGALKGSGISARDSRTIVLWSHAGQAGVMFAGTVVRLFLSYVLS